MGILINGMEMPKSCYVCPFCDYVSARCDAVKGNPYTPESRYEKRADFCPLVPVPPHGEWVNTGSDIWECSACGYRVMPWNAGVNFCPNCGADMREVT